jgi:hypothetical protein
VQIVELQAVRPDGFLLDLGHRLDLLVHTGIVDHDIRRECPPGDPRA